MLYEPPRSDRCLWDTWLLPVPEAGTYHLFHMQKVAGEADSIEIGHAVSPDLVRWTALDPALVAGPPGDWDGVRLRTGTALRHAGRAYLFYGAAPDHVDRVGVATSTDLLRWERHGRNPIAVPDSRWYEHDHATCPLGNVAWRDPCIRRDGDGWIMYLTARLPDGAPGGRATVATLRARDLPAGGGLLRWEVGPPLAVPPGFVAMEVPDVFELDGRWFLLHSTSHAMGTPFPTCDPGLTAGTFVLWAERPEGPYERPPRDVLVGGPAQRMTAYVCRTAEIPLGRIAYYHNVYPPAPGSRARRGSFALPKGLAVDERGLKLRYLPLLEPYLCAPLAPPLLAAAGPAGIGRPGSWELEGDGASGHVPDGTSLLPLACPGGGARDVMLTATVTVEAGWAAGFALRSDPGGQGLAVLLDAGRGTVGVVALESATGTGAAADPATGTTTAQVLAERSVETVRPGARLALRVVLARSVVDVFLDEELLLSVVAEGYGGGGIALLATRARVRFTGVLARRIVLPEPLRERSTTGA